MRTHTFMTTAKKLASTTGRSIGVKVRFSGATAYTDGTLINLPNLPAGTILTETQDLVFSGYLDHESAHVRWTDFAHWDKQATRLKQLLHNLFEDIRVENRHIEEYPGSATFLNALAENIDEADRNSQEGIADDATKILSATYREVWKYRGVTVRHAPDLKDLSLPAASALRELIKGLPKAKSTKATGEMAVEAEKILKDLLKETKQEQAGGGGQKGNGGSQPSNQQIQKELEEAAEKYLKKTDRGRGIEATVKEVRKKNSKMGTDPAAKQKKQRYYYDPEEGDRVLPPADRSLDKVFVPSGKDRPRYEQLRSGLEQTVRAMRKRLNIYLLSRRKRAWARGLEDGQKLDADALHQLWIGDEKVMKEPRSRKMVNTAVEFMVDLSSSMDDNLTPQTGILIAEAMAGVRLLKLEVTGFTTNNQVSSVIPQTGRRNGMDVLVFKGFDESYEKARPRLGAMYTSGYTPLGDAYGLAMERLLSRREPRKILWMVTDGFPEFSKSESRHDDLLLMKEIKEKCKKLRIETVGIYIGTAGATKLQPYFERAYGVTGPTDLAPLTLDLVRELMG